MTKKNIIGTAKEPKERLSITLTESMVRRLEAVASDLGLSRGQYVAVVTGQAVNNQERLQDAMKNDMLRVMLEDMNQ
ncbi:hypothetical protein PT158_08715 [Erysipelothrix rhusiopathiae]|nr:hypothetical protein [Erysipelothrix rhusiopathiae]